MARTATPGCLSDVLQRFRQLASESRLPGVTCHQAPRSTSPKGRITVPTSQAVERFKWNNRNKMQSTGPDTRGDLYEHRQVP